MKHAIPESQRAEESENLRVPLPVGQSSSLDVGSVGSGFQNFMSNGDSHGTRTRVMWDGVLLNRNLRRILQTKVD